MTIWNSVPAGMYVAMGLVALVLACIAVFTIAVVHAMHRGSTPTHSKAASRTPERSRDDASIGRSASGASMSDASPAGATPPPGKPKTILVAEDDPIISLALSLRLKRLGFEVWCSPDALHALMGSERLHPDAAILDVAMPGGDGLAVCEMLAADPATANMPRIVHTSHADQSTKVRCRELGAHYVEKSSTSWRQIQAILEKHFGPLAETSTPADGRAESQRNAAPQAVNPALSPACSPVCGRARVTCVGPDSRLGPIERQLTDLGASPLPMYDADDAFWTCVSDRPHLVVLDGASPPDELRALIRRFGEHPITRDLPLAVVGENDAVDPAAIESGRIVILPAKPSNEELLRKLGTYLPLRTSEMPPPPRKESRDGDESPESVHPTILCIDDDQEIAHALSMRLEPYGITVRAAMTGSDGIHDALGRTPDLILLDLKMPDGEGNYVLSRMKSHPLLEDIPIVFLTGESNPAVARQMISLGAAGFLSKPVRWEDLFAEIGRHIELPDQLIRDYHLADERLLAAR